MAGAVLFRGGKKVFEVIKGSEQNAGTRGVAGITQRPEVDVFTQTRVSQKRYAAGLGGVRDSY